MNKIQLIEKISEVLILTQFEHWIDKGEHSAEERNARKKRAIGYYLGLQQTKPGEIMVNKFNILVKIQTAMIMREVEKLSPSGA